MLSENIIEIAKPILFWHQYRTNFVKKFFPPIILIVNACLPRGRKIWSALWNCAIKIKCKTFQIFVACLVQNGKTFLTRSVRGYDHSLAPYSAIWGERHIMNWKLKKQKKKMKIRNKHCLLDPPPPPPPQLKYWSIKKMANVQCVYIV